MKPVDTQFQFIPYDYYCPSVHSKLNKRICKKCNIYFATVKALTHHNKLMHKKKVSSGDALSKVVESNSKSQLEDSDDEEENKKTQLDVDNDTVPVIDNLEEWITCPWTEL